MSRKFRIEFGDISKRWLEFEFQISDYSFYSTASGILNNPVQELVIFAKSLLRSRTETPEALFWLEPSGLILRTTDDAGDNGRVLNLVLKEDAYQPGSSEETLFTGTVSPVSIGQAVLTSVTRLREKVAGAKSSGDWKQDYPENDVEELRALLRAARD